MAVKTKRSSVRTALLASASLAALAQGANAAIGFTADAATPAGGHAFANGVTPACAELIFLKSTGALVDYKTFADAADKTLYEKGRAVVITVNTETQFDHCETEAGYYLHVVAAGTTDGTGLRIEQAPAGWYAPGGIQLDTSTATEVVAVAAASLVSSSTNVASTTVDICAAGTFNSAIGATSCTNCPGNSFSAAGATVCTPCPEGTEINTAGDDFCKDIAAGYYGAVGSNTAHATVSKCPAGTTNIGASTGTATKCDLIAENYYGTIGTSTAHATVTACPAGTISAGYTAAAGTFFCDGIAEGYYGMLGEDADGGYHAVVTACPAGSTSDGTAVAGTAGQWQAITDCVTKPGYYLSTAGLTGHVAGTITKVPAGYYATGDVAIDSSGAAVIADTSTAQPGDFSSSASFGRCPANSNSEAGATFCVCNAGYAPIYETASLDTSSGGVTTSAGSAVVSECAPISGYVAASPTAASPTADSAGASTPIAVALAAAAAVPLLL